MYNPLPVLKTYLPVLVFLFLGLVVGFVFVQMNKIIGPKKPGQVKREPYECGLPSEVTRNFRFGVSFYLVAMLFILFDVLLKSVGTFALVETIVFVVLLFIGFVYVWRRGALEWT